MPGAVLRLLGRPPGWGGQDDLLDTLHDLYRVASASVRDAAFADLGDATTARLTTSRERQVDRAA